MLKTATTIFLGLATSFTFLLISPPPPKSFYHSLYISTSLSDNTSISHHLHTLTRRPHAAGSEANAEAAAYVLSIFTSSNIKSHIASYEVSLTYPSSRSLTLIPPPPETPTTFNLRQEIYDGDPYADVADEVQPTFHAYAKSGTVSGLVVYVNYGRIVDYSTLKEMGVNVSGTIVLARYGEIYRGNIVKNAYEEGAIGALLYTDRKDYGGGGGDTRWFPDEKWMPPSGVQVGTVYNGIGDPTTPGWASTGNCERLSEEEVEKGGDVPLIPSLPISGADGETILRSVGGDVAHEDWQGSIDAPTYRVGPGPGIINLSYTGNQIIGTIQNVIGIIEGAEEPDRFVILGNHRDAWTFGAVDPNSGTAALLEVAERLGKLQKKGWKPRRTIVLCNWDAEEYGLVQDPENSSQTIYDSWVDSSNSPPIGRLGDGGSDFAAFVQHVGIPAAAMFFGGGYPVYHSMYDDFVWMEKFGDPMFHRHVAVGSVWGLVALWLADEEFLPFNYLSYAKELQKSTKDLKDEISETDISLNPLFKSIEELHKAATTMNNQRKEIIERKGWTSMWNKDHLKVRELNDRLMMAERAFTDKDGLFGRSWYKHLIYGPSKHDDYGSKTFPGIDDAIEKAKNLNTADSWRAVQHEVWRVSRAVKHASLVLNGKLT
ncbi:probable glutamate carboxypeptidase LAMP1 isoform X4 [Quercus robur]|uniref:probable glutamate carboxypeptidase LAMP1 isoform X4 n=1 Tax=Quercus robur TaxID=38942 RepID=UPI0021638F14|nr:probable glutamate carboxypeptidase LAMP1 isoform X4 [Quercus robur]